MAEIEFTCSDCGKMYRVTPGNYPWEKGWRKITYNRCVCRACWNEYYKKKMIKDGCIGLKVDLEKGIVHDGSNSDLHFRIAFSKDTTKSAWGNTQEAKLIRFIGPDGKVWSGSKSKWGYNCLFRRITTKPQNIAKG